MVEIDQRRLQQARRATFEDYRQRHISAWIGPRGTSMRPLIGPDTWLHVEFGAAEVAVGDIVVFPLGEILVAHRVVARKNRQSRLALVAKGDAEPYPDPPVQPSDVLGVVRALRQGRHGRSSQFGCAGTSAQLVGQVSRLVGYAASTLRRLVMFLPDPLRRPALAGIPPLVRVVARIIFAPLPWATWRDRSQ